MPHFLILFPNLILKDGYDWGRLNLQSVTEQDTYTGKLLLCFIHLKSDKQPTDETMFCSDFMNTAEMAGRDFDAEKWNVKLLDAQTRQVQLLK